ncbi:MAG: hypothetical protein ACRDUX_10390 [Mycobacterium sp.]
MTIREIRDRPVIVLGRQTDLAETVVSSLGSHGSPVVRIPPQQPDTAADSIIVMIDQAAVHSMFAGARRGASRGRMRAYENTAADSAVTTALKVRAKRLLVVCDTSRLSFGHRLRAISWVRNLLRRIAYACAINGLPDLATRYTLVDTADDARRTTDAILLWHRKNESPGPRPPTAVGCVRPGVLSSVSARLRG